MNLLTFSLVAGIDTTLRLAKKCLQDADREMEILEENPLAWTTFHCPHNSVYTIAAMFLLKLHLCDVIQKKKKNIRALEIYRPILRRKIFENLFVIYEVYLRE